MSDMICSLYLFTYPSYSGAIDFPFVYIEEAIKKKIFKNKRMKKLNLNAL